MQRRSNFVCKTAAVIIFFLPCLLCSAVSVSFEAGTPTGWDFYDLDSDIVKNNTVDWDDLAVLAGHWLNSGCDDANQWCGGADIDVTGQVDFFDYVFLANDWAKQGASDVLLQTIYGTAQDDANGTITANGYDAIENLKGNAMAFAVPQNTALDKAIFKCFKGTAWAAGDVIQIRFYNVTGLNYLSYSGHPTVTRANPGGGGPLLFETFATIPSSMPTHSELDDGRYYADMIIDFESMAVEAGEYLIAIDRYSGSSTTGSMVRGNATTSLDMGKYPDGTPLPKQATVSASGFTGNTFHYELSSNTIANYTARSYLWAFQITTTVASNNTPPVVNAGTNQTIINPDNDVNLDGTVTDDGRPDPPAAVTTQWTKQSGPGTVTFGDAASVDTTASFSAYGTYVLRLTANDGLASSYDEVTITYSESAPQNQAPVVNAGADRQVVLPSQASLDGTVSDDGLPTPPGAVATQWTKQSGPGTVTFGSANAVDTTASFSDTGTYVLRLTANDSLLSSYDEVTVTVQPATNEGLYHVTTLAASGAGSLDDCITQANTDGKPSRIVFDVSGTIKPGKGFSLTAPDTRICGTEAPGSGITIDFNGATGGFSVPGASSGCRFCNLRIINTKTNTDGISLFGPNNIVERCSFNLCRDEAVGMSGSRGNVVAFSRIENCGSQPGDGTNYADGRGILLTGSGSTSSSAVIVGNYIYHCNRGITANTGATFMDCRNNRVEYSLSPGSGAGITNAGVSSNTINNVCSYNATSGLSYKTGCTFYRSGNSGENNAYAWHEFVIPEEWLECPDPDAIEHSTPIVWPDLPYPAWLVENLTTPATGSDVGMGTGPCQCVVAR